MKIISTVQMRQADAYTINNEPISSLELMERAASTVSSWISKRVSTEKKILIFCGMGNNGGDGLVVARQLTAYNIFSQVFLVHTNSEMSQDCQDNLERLKQETNISVFEIDTPDDFPSIESGDLLIDSLFGSGLNRPLQGLSRDLVIYLNQFSNVKVSIDMPSGLYADKAVNSSNIVLCADYTLTFQLPKLAFMFPECNKYVGRWEVLKIGLSERFMAEVATQNYFVTSATLKKVLHPRDKFSHKGTYGHALLVAGSQGKAGAAILSARACMRSGVGLLHTHVPKSLCQSMQTAFPETMLSIDESDVCFSRCPNLDLFTAVGIGPGLGTAKETAIALKMMIQNTKVPMVLDADALNIISENKTWLEFLNPNTILTPHPKEFERLVGKWNNSFERLDLQRQFSERYGLIVVLKGAHTSITYPDGKCIFNATGNPGMATAGSGDVLTGMILSLLAQHYSPHEAAILGVYLHGLAGDIAMEKVGMESLIASDIVNNIGPAFIELRKN